MANINAPRGFKLYQLEGKVVRSREYAKTSGQDIYEGDLLMRIPAGTVSVYVAGTAPAAGRVIGVAAASSLSTDADVVQVIDDPEATFICQCDATTAYAVADNGLNCDIAGSPSPDTDLSRSGGSPSPDTDLSRSGQVLDLATKAVTDTLPVKVMELAPQINNNENSAAINADLLVKVNSSERAAGTAGI